MYRRATARSRNVLVAMRKWAATARGDRNYAFGSEGGSLLRNRRKRNGRRALPVFAVLSLASAIAMASALLAVYRIGRDSSLSKRGVDASWSHRHRREESWK